MKNIYSFDISTVETVLKKVIEQKRRKNKKTNKFEKVDVEVEKEVEEKDTYNFLIKKPSRKDLKDADIFYSVKLNSYIKQGILTQKQVFNTYVNNGGILSEQEDQEAFEALVELNEIKNELQKLSADKFIEEDKSKKQDIKLELLNKQRLLYDMLYEIELKRDAIFSNCADTIARSDLIEWWVLRLCYFKKSEEDDEKYKLFFGSDVHSESYNKLCELEDSQDELYTKMIEVAAPVVTIWSMSGHESQEEIDKALKGDV